MLRVKAKQALWYEQLMIEINQVYQVIANNEIGGSFIKAKEIQITGLYPHHLTYKDMNDKHSNYMGSISKVDFYLNKYKFIKVRSKDEC